MAGELDDLYDEATVVALDRFVRIRRPVPAVVAAGWRGRLGAGAIFTAAVIQPRISERRARRRPSCVDTISAFVGKAEGGSGWLLRIGRAKTASSLLA